MNWTKKSYQFIRQKLNKLLQPLSEISANSINIVKEYEVVKQFYFKLESDFAQIEMPFTLKETYSAMMYELERRAHYSDFITHIIKKLKKLVNYENKKREEFFSTYGNRMPQNLCPEVELLAPCPVLTPKPPEELYKNVLKEKIIQATVPIRQQYFKKFFQDFSLDMEFLQKKVSDSEKEIEKL